MKLVRVNPDIDWTSVESRIPGENIYGWFVSKFDHGFHDNMSDDRRMDFRLNLTTSVPYLYDTKTTKWARPISDWRVVDVLLKDWHYTGTILVTETIYGKNSGVLADYQNDGTFVSEDGDVWKLTELISWES